MLVYLFTFKSSSSALNQMHDDVFLLFRPKFNAVVNMSENVLAFLFEFFYIEFKRSLLFSLKSWSEV